MWGTTLTAFIFDNYWRAFQKKVAKGDLKER